MKTSALTPEQTIRFNALMALEFKDIYQERAKYNIFDAIDYHYNTKKAVFCVWVDLLSRMTEKEYANLFETRINMDHYFRKEIKISFVERNYEYSRFCNEKEKQLLYIISCVFSDYGWNSKPRNFYNPNLFTIIFYQTY